MKRVRCVIFLCLLGVLISCFILEYSKPIIKMATYSIDDSLQELINYFNSNYHYKIELVDYSEDDLITATKKLEQDILAEKIDLIYMSSFPYNFLKDKNFFANLSTMVSGGYKYLKENFVLEKNDIDEEVYQVSLGFTVNTFASSRNHWDWKNVFDMIDVYDGSIFGLEKTQFVMQMFFCNFDFFIDFDGAKTFKNQNEFRRIVEFSEQLDIAYGESQIAYVELPDFIELQSLGFYFERPYYLLGFPSVDANCAVLVFSPGFSVSAYTKKSDACMDFIEYCLSDKIQNFMMQTNFWFPVSLSVLGDLAKSNMSVAYAEDEYGNQREEPRGYSYTNGMKLELYSASQLDVDSIMKLIDDADKVIYYDYSIMEILSKFIDKFYQKEIGIDELLRKIDKSITDYIDALN